MRALLLPVLLCLGYGAKAQEVDSLFFNLYTDSLKKGVYNYINVDARLKNGRWMPLTDKELRFSATAGRFEGNSLIIDTSFSGSAVQVTVVMKADARISRSITIPIKRKTDDEPLKKPEEVMPVPRSRRRGG